MKTLSISHWARAYQSVQIIALAMSPSIAIWYLASFSAEPPLRFEDHLFHEIAIAIATAIGSFVSYVSWKSYQASGEVFLRWLTVGLLAFTLIYAPHGLLTRAAHHNMWLFLLYGPASRLAMLGCMVYGLRQFGKAPEMPNTISASGFWRYVFLACVIVVILVAVLAYSPIAGSPWVRLPMEVCAALLCVVGIATMFWQRIRSPLMTFYAVGLVFFAQAAVAFMMAKPWNHMWWLAHVIFAIGFSIMGWGVVRALLTTRSFSLAYSEEQLVLALEHERGQLAATVASLQSSDAHLQSVFDASPDALIISDAEGMITMANRQVQPLFGYAPIELIGRPIEVLVPEPYRANHGKLRAGYVMHPSIRPMGVAREVIALRKDGRELQVEVSLSFIKTELGILVASALRDVTDRKRAQASLEYANAQLALRTQEAEEASRAKSLFLANMSHEIRTPLNAITGMTHIIRRNGIDPDQEDKLVKIENAGKLLLGIINSVLDLSKIEAGRFALDEHPLRIEELLESIVSLVEDRVAEKGLSLQLEVERPMPEGLVGDTLRLQQILLNYVSNAIKFTTVGSIVLRAKIIGDSAEDAMLRFEVSDTGIGIAPAVIPRLFSAFEQADNSISRKFGGTGLGLTIAHKIAKLMGGTTGVASEVGKGSMFWLTVHLRKASTDHGAVSPQPQVETEQDIRRRYAGARILLAEDEPVNTEVALALMKSVGLVTDAALDGVEAVDLAARNDYALILMDMQMPNMDGLEATRRIRQFSDRRRIPILALTANAFAGDQQRCSEAGMDDFIPKPVDPEIFFATLLRWLGRAEG